MKERKSAIEEVKDLITSFAGKELSSEEETICLHIWEKLARKRMFDITRTRPDIWAAAVIWSFCRANFKYEEGVTLDRLCSFFGNNKSTVGNKAGEISRMLRIDFFNPEFTIERIQKANPLNRFTMTNDRFIVPKDATSYSEKLVRYRRLRSVQQGLNHVLMPILPPDALQECGAKLGLFHDNAFVLGAQSEMDVIMDYCLYEYRWEGHNTIERYVSQTRIEAGSDERIVLDAMLKPRYSLFQVDEVLRGLGVRTDDVLRGDTGFIMDVALSETAVKGFVLACRIISPAVGFSMSTGAGLPVDRDSLKRIATELPRQFGMTSDEIVRMSPEKASEFSASIIRILLEGDAASHMRFEDVVTPARKASSNVGRNAPCPCGSGKKYKKCCGR